MVGFLGDLQLFEQRLRESGVVGDAVNAGDEVEVLTHGEVIEKTRFVGKESEQAFGRDGVGGEIDAADAHRAAARRDDAGEAAQRARLAGAVGPDEAEDLARLHGER